MIDKYDNDQNIDLKGTYNVINSKQQTFSEINAIRSILVCYEDVRDVFVSRKESVFSMQTHFDMGTIISFYNVKTPVNNDQGVNKSYADSNFLKLSGGTVSGNIAMQNARIFNLPDPNGENQAATKIYTDNKFLPLAGGTMTANLNMNDNKITILPQATVNGDAIDFKFYHHYTPRGIRDNDGDFDFRDSMLYSVKKITLLYISSNS